MKEQIAFVVVGVVVIVGVFLGIMYFLRFFSAATLHTQLITPKPGIECVVISATDSTSVDCWKAL
jgi:hypothetical protein